MILCHTAVNLPLSERSVDVSASASVRTDLTLCLAQASVQSNPKKIIFHSALLVLLPSAFRAVHTYTHTERPCFGGPAEETVLLNKLQPT